MRAIFSITRLSGSLVHHEMPTPAERKALVFLSSVIVLGGATRLYRSIDGQKKTDPATAAALTRQLSIVDSAIAKKGKRRGKTSRAGKVATPDPPAVPAVLDLDFASAEQIETLRGIGPAMAARIVADRDSLGAFGGLAALERVRGIGPALAGKLAAHVTFSGVPRPVNTVVSRRSVKSSPKRKSRRREEGY